MKRLELKNIVMEARRPDGRWEEIIHNVSFTVKPGEVIALIGESGAGKSTVGLMALGYTRPGVRVCSGEVLLNGKNVLKMGAEEKRQLRGQKVAYVAQSAAMGFNPSMTLGTQVLESVAVHNQQRKQKDDNWVVELFKLLNLPDSEILVDRYPHQVSGGQLQRVMTAMAMSCLPEYIVFDEPTTALDVTTQIEVLKAIKDVIKQKGTGAIYVTHDLSVVAQMADRIVVLRYGRQVEENPTTEIISNPQHEYTRELMGAVRTIPPIGSITIENQCVLEEKKPLLSLVDICASYKRKSLFTDVREKDFVLKDVSFEVHSGEVVALVGESGSGKSTIARVIAGLLPPISGGVLYRGLHLDGSYKARSLRQLRRFQFVVQSPDTSLNPERSVLDIIGRPLELYGTLADAQKRTRVEELLEMVELPADYADRFPMELSGGERQRISLARAIAADPDLLLCDEVLSALDTIVAASVLELMKKLRKKLNMAYLFISHDLATVAEIADRVIVLYAGRVCENGPADKVFAPPYHPYTALLLQSVPQLKTGWLEDVISDRIDHANAVRDVQEAPLACAFRNRCPYYDTVVCDRPARQPHKLGDDHFIFCHRGIDELMSGTNPGA